jgi:hypothetical protein
MAFDIGYSPLNIYDQINSTCVLEGGQRAEKSNAKALRRKEKR